MDKAGVDLGATGRLHLMAKLAEGEDFTLAVLSLTVRVARHWIPNSAERSECVDLDPTAGANARRECAATVSTDLVQRAAYCHAVFYALEHVRPTDVSCRSWYTWCNS